MNKIARRLKNVGSAVKTDLKRRYESRVEAERRSRLGAILADTKPPITKRGESDFETLQNKYHGIPMGDYYSEQNRWFRAAERCKSLIKICPSHPKNVLEVGCGDGMTGFLLSTYGHTVSLTDMDDWREKRAKSLPFTKAQMEGGLDYPKDTFDLVFSYETFEHVVDPGTCLDEIRRVCRPGGTVYLHFGPLYASAWGLHAFSTLRMPYAQYLFSDEYINDTIKRIGVHDLAKDSTTLQPMNRWRVKDFWDICSPKKWEIIQFDKAGPKEFLELVERYPEAFRGRGLNYEDLITQSLTVELRRIC